MAAADVDFVETFRIQLGELELMQSMYPKDSEFAIDDPRVVVDMSDYVNGRTTNLPSSRLEYCVNMQTELATFEVSCTFPHGYPSTVAEPELYVRSQRLNRTQQHRLNEDATMVAQLALRREESCVLAVLQWLSDNGASYVQASSDDALRSVDIEKSDDTPEDGRLNVDRYWIYSHHIYNKTKRKNILELASDHDISGFCLPGKPGIICAEGTAADCADFWDRLKHMNWKKIVCKKMEHEEGERRFPAFNEVTFEGRRTGGGRMDFGAFLAYLEDRNCGYIFKDYFGIDGRTGLMNKLVTD